jgi:hypothetical protein
MLFAVYMSGKISEARKLSADLCCTRKRRQRCRTMIIPAKETAFPWWMPEAHGDPRSHDISGGYRAPTASRQGNGRLYDRLTTRHRYCRSGEVACFVRCQHDIYRRKFGWLARAFHRDL